MYRLESGVIPVYKDLIISTIVDPDGETTRAPTVVYKDLIISTIVDYQGVF